MNFAMQEEKNSTSIYTELEFRAAIHSVKTILEDFAKTGINIPTLQKKFAEIINRVEGNKNNSRESDGQIDYDSILKELKSLEKDIKKVEPYLLAIKNANYVVDNINPESTCEEIEGYANLIVITLKAIRKLNKTNIVNEYEIIKRIYQIAYETIKVEVIKTGTSIIVTNANKIEKTLFDEFIRADLANIDLSNPKYKDITKRIFEIEKQGISKSYCDSELIRLIAINSENKFREVLIANIDEIVNQINTNNKDLAIKVTEIDEYLDRKKQFRKESQKVRVSSIKEIIAIILASTITLGGAYGTFRLARKAASGSIYSKNVTTYVEGTDYPQTTQEEVNTMFSNIIDEVEIIEYQAWDTSSEEPTREVNKYVLYGITLDSIYDYLKYQLTEQSPVDTKEVTSNYELDREKYSKPFKEVNMITYEDTGKIEIDTGFCILFTVLFELLYFAIWLGIFSAYEMISGNTAFPFEELSEDLDKLKELKEEYGINNKEFKKKLKEIMDKINTNKELKKKFEKIFEENKYLLANPEELRKQINELESSQNKTKTRLIKRRILG